MIIIATNNGKRNLSELLENLKEFGLGRSVCIIDTGSTDQDDQKKITTDQYEVFVKKWMKKESEE